MINLKLLESPFYEHLPQGGNLAIDETELEGQMHLRLTVNNEAIKFSIKPGNGFSYLKNKRTPDHIVFVKSSTGWIVKIFECKRTIKEKTWEDVKQQFAGGVYHAKMLAAILDIPSIEGYRVFTVYQNDRIQDRTTDPALLRRLIGVRIEPREHEKWNDTAIKVVEGYEPFEHRRIQVREDGTQEFEIT